MQPTADAQLLSERAIETLGALAALQEAVREIAAGTRGRLGLGSFPPRARCRPRALGRLGRDFGDVEVPSEDGEPRELLTRLLEGDLDVIVLFRYDLVPQSWPAGSVRRRCSPSPCDCWCPTSPAPLGARGVPPGMDTASSGPVPLTDFEGASWISTREAPQGPSPSSERAPPPASHPHPLSQQ